jgi:hypothetical protein
MEQGVVVGIVVVVVDDMMRVVGGEVVGVVGRDMMRVVGWEVVGESGSEVVGFVEEKWWVW